MAREVVRSSTIAVAAAMLEFDLTIVVVIAASGAITIGIMATDTVVTAAVVVALGFVESIVLCYRIPVVSVHGLERIIHGGYRKDTRLCSLLPLRSLHSWAKWNCGGRRRKWEMVLLFLRSVLN